MTPHWLAIGSALAGLAVVSGAFGAHGLKQHLLQGADGSLAPMEIFETAARYHMYHALAVLFVGVVKAMDRTSRWLDLAGWMFVLGILLFSGSLYALAISRVRWLGAITPLGGVCFLIGWGVLMWCSVRSRPASNGLR
jgi:uncharacterized membrane protein YgdD (TMEM256/DUF423 family)